MASVEGCGIFDRQRDRRGRREPGGRLESVPTGRRPGRAPWRRGSGGAPAGSATWCCGVLRGESLEALSREAGVEIYRLDPWRERAMAGLELGLKGSSRRATAEVLDAAKRHIGGTVDWRSSCSASGPRAAEQRLPLAMRRSRR